ncbi:hypothetical protein NMT72_24745, partial [Escherichia coli]|nr:hypothetical protein [Escherichia coli]
MRCWDNVLRNLVAQKRPELFRAFPFAVELIGAQHLPAHTSTSRVLKLNWSPSDQHALCAEFKHSTNWNCLIEIQRMAPLQWSTSAKCSHVEMADAKHTIRQGLRRGIQR